MPGGATFGPATLAFLAGLRADNEKSWFDAHRADYEHHYLAPALAFITGIGPKLAAFQPDVHAEPRVNGSLFRINRDIRFSRDRTPYKDHVDLFFWIGEGRSRERPGFFLRLRPEELLLGAGMHGFPPPILEAYRAAVLDDERGTALETAIAAAETAGAAVEGNPLQRLPAGLDPSHPRAGLLRHRALHATFREPIPAAFGGPGFIDHCVERFRPLSALLTWVGGL
jgi:uncharacterized protein (TIGR02453 family)